ncbi:parallel beta helix pectate lyase-like protein [Mesobacillus foraminis]|uniref:Parallel beta helix pectate lyase-like protein n=1 Tax=Mesobacillus foraminis TaxID=279826 RepID=A0A4R2B7D3_9BACI|nr:right-handed parallel beta-helix repeat-containing protein [Mesobacillus foraminis]TCN22205.1 parallel beta helix pectate lyase-like protein [Mesobacillus foraminis]
MRTPIYELELARWGVYNDGTHPVETTRGINTALKWAKENGYKTFKVPDGTYLIAKGTQPGDSEARVNLVSEMDFLLSDKAVFQKETNHYEIYSVLYLGTGVKNVTIKGGTYRGDRDTHNYSIKGDYTGGTHEWGTGINIVGAENVEIQGLKLEKFTGDGITINASTITGSAITELSVETGGLDDYGNPIPSNGKIRTNNRSVTNFDHSAYNIYRNIYFWLPQGITPNSKVDVFYYRKDGTFIKSDKQIRYYSGESIIPDGADYFRAVFEAPSTKGFVVNRMTVAISKNIIIKNNDIGHNRRQGISLVGSDGVQILENIIHHTNGTAPQSGIDIEPGFFPGRNTTIERNKFIENRIQIVMADGENVLIKGNYFEQTGQGNVGVHGHAGFRGEIVISDNIFSGSGLTLHPENVQVSNNKFSNGEVNLVGKNITFTNASLFDTSLSSGNQEGQIITNVSIQHNGIRPGILYFGNYKVQFNNINVNAKTQGKGLIFGNGNNESIYDRFLIEDIDKKGTILPAGVYNQCNFEAGVLTINRGGAYTFTSCFMKDKGNIITVNSQQGNVTIQQSILEITENIGYGAAIYILGAQNIKIINSKILAPNNTNATPLIKLGPYGAPKPTTIFNATIKENTIYTKTSIPGIETTNAGVDAPPYLVEDNTLYNAKLYLSSKDINLNNKLL